MRSALAPLFRHRLLLVGLCALLLLGPGCAIADGFSGNNNDKHNNAGTMSLMTGNTSTGDTGSDTSGPMTSTSTPTTSATGSTGTPTAPPIKTACDDKAFCVEKTVKGSDGSAPLKEPVFYLEPEPALRIKSASPRELKMGKYIGEHLYVTGIANLADKKKKNELEIDVIKIFPGEFPFEFVSEGGRPAPYASTIKVPFTNLEADDSKPLEREQIVIVDSISSHAPDRARHVTIKGRLMQSVVNEAQSMHSFIVTQPLRFLNLAKPQEFRVRLLKELSATPAQDRSRVQELVFNPLDRGNSPLYVIGHLPSTMSKPFNGKGALEYNTFMSADDGVNIGATRREYDFVNDSTRELHKISSLTEDYDAQRFFFLEQAPAIHIVAQPYTLYQSSKITPFLMDGLAVEHVAIDTPSLAKGVDTSCTEIEYPNSMTLDAFIAQYKRFDTGLVKHHPQSLLNVDDGVISYSVPYLYKPKYDQKWLILLQASQAPTLGKAKCLPLPPNDDVIAYSLQDPADPSSYALLSAISGEGNLTLRLAPTQGCGGTCPSKTIEYTLVSYAVAGAYTLGVGQGFVIALSNKNAVTIDANDIIYVHMDKDGVLTNKLRGVAEEANGPVSPTPR